MAVYTDVSRADLDAFLAAYDLGSVVAFEGIRDGVENSNYLLDLDNGRYILTLYEKRVEPDDLPFFLGLMDHLASRDVPCPTPIHGRDGASLRMLCGRPAALVTFLQGRSVRRILPHHCAKLGQALAAMHLAGSDLDLHRANALSVDGWRPLFESSRDRADEVRPGLADRISRELDLLERTWPDRLPGGVIHADLFPDNVFFAGDRLSGLIDFYFACNDSFAYDIAVCLNAWCFEDDRQFNITKAQALLAGYGRRRPLARAERDALPLLARGAALRFLLTRLFDWLNQVEGALVRPKDPLEFARKLRFHQRVMSPAAYGLD